MKRSRPTTPLVLLALLTVGVSDAMAHGEATLKSSSDAVAAGGTITVDGADFEPGEEHRLILRGPLDDHELTTVTARADSTFHLEVTIPAGTRSGQYRLVALAPDGDAVASLDLAVTSPETPAEAMAPAEDAVPETHGTEASPDEIRIERSRSGVEWGIIGLLIGLAGGLGLGLLRRA